VLNARVDEIYGVLVDCCDRFGVHHVIFDDDEFVSVQQPPPVHVDPAGQVRRSRS
jgi:hypothetical protein